MLVEDLDSLKLWMTKTLTGVCDADPAALTRYVLALLKKEKQESEIRENCLDQLDVFLQNKTVAFVDSLFKTLKDKSYVGLSTNVHSTSASAPKAAVVVPQSAPAVQQVVPDTTNSVKDSVTGNKQDINKEKKKTDEVSIESRSSRDSRRKRSRTRSRSRSSSPRRRDSDDRRRRHDRSRYSPPTRRYSGRRGRSRERSRSRSPGRRWSPDRDRRRSRSPRNRSRDRSRSWSRSRSRGKQPDSRGSTPTQDNGTYSSIPVTTNTGSRIPSSIAVVTSSDDSRKDKPGTGPSPRCRDYDEKGFCMRGDLCPYDHGVDPVIVEDSGIPCVIPYPPAAPGPHPPGIPPPPPGMPPITAHPPPNFSHPPPPIRQRPPPPTEVYNPEAPQITGPRPPFWQGVGPRPQRPSVPPPGPPRPPVPSVTPVPFYSQPPPNQAAAGRQRDLVQVPTIPKENEDSQEATPEVKAKSFIESRVVVPSKRTFDMIDTTTETQASQPKKNFDYARLGGYRKPNPNMENNCLEVRKIPREFNNIAKLNEHFAKFGTLTNIQICFEDDPEAALITYIDNQSAFSAYRSSEPVFNNRFIKVFWHKKQDVSGQQGNGEPTTVTTTQQTPPDTMSVKSRLGTIPHPSKMSLNNKTKGNENEIVYTSSLGHLKKTVFNPTAGFKASSALTSPTAVGTADFVKRIEEIKKKEDLKQEALKKKVEIQKQKQNLLEKQISQQKVLIEKLDKNKNLSAEERTVIMDSLKTLTASIDKLKSELMPQKNTTKNLDETRKEILDTELELINKQKTGEDTTALRLKLTQLTKEAQALGIFGRGRGRGMRSRGRGIRGRGAFLGFGRGRGPTGGMTLDNRPKVLEVRNFELSEKEEIKNHFGLLAPVEKCEFVDTIPSAIITFTTRKGAESALSRGSKWKNKQLTVRWYMGITRTVSADSVGGDSDDDESGLAEELDEDSLLAADDEEEEDEESRSWRR